MIQRVGSMRWWLPILLVSLVVIGAAAAWQFAKKKRTYPEYNVVLITFDTTRADRLGCYGAASARTPNIDTLASQGIRFARCYSPGPITLPSHTSLLTGLYPFRHGLRDNNAGRLSDEAVTLPEILKGAGYQTGAVIGAYVLDSRFGLEQGFDMYDDDLSQAERDSMFHIAERNAEAVSSSAIAWLDKAQASKFFLWAHYFDPHANYAPPGVDIAAMGPITPEKSRQLYDAEIAYADQQMGRLLKRIGEIQESTGRPTLIVLTSDHGESLGDHGEPTHGMFVYNDTIHTPLILFDSTARDRGIVVEEPVSLVDVMPSMLARLGLSLPYEIDGRGLPQSSDARKRDSDHRPIYFETMMTFNTYGWSPLEGVVQGHDKLIVAPKPEFFDLEADPREANNIHEDGAPRVESLWTALEDLKDAPSECPSLTVDEAPLDQQALAKLMALGYVGNVTSSDEIPDDLPDPKDRVHLHMEFLSAQSLSANNQSERAFEKVRSVLMQDPDNKYSLKFIGHLMTKAEPKVAPHVVIELMQRLIKLRPDNSEYAFVLGKAHAEADDVETALPEFDRAVELDPNNAEALNHYAWYSYKRGDDLETASERSQRAVALKPNDPHMRHTLACILLQQDRAAEATKHLEVALELAPEFAAAHYHLGVAREELGEDAAATESLRRAIELAGESQPDWLSDAEARLARLSSSS